MGISMHSHPRPQQNALKETLLIYPWVAVAIGLDETLCVEEDMKSLPFGAHLQGSLKEAPFWDTPGASQASGSEHDP